MHAHRAVDELRDRHVAGDARELVGLMLVHLLRRCEEVDHLLDRDSRRDAQVDIGAHRDVMRVRFTARPRQLHSLAHGQLDASAQRGFDRGLIDFAVALRGMAVADFEERAFHVHRNEQRRSGDQLLVVEIARVRARRVAADAAHFGCRSDAHAAEERPERNDDARQERRRHVLAIEADDRLRAALLAVLPHVAAAAVVAVGDRQIDRQHLHLERVTGLGAVDVDRTGQDVAAGAAILDLIDDGAERGLDLACRHAGFFEPIRRVGQQRVDVDDVAGINRQYRLRLSPVMPVRDRRGRRFEPVCLRRLRTGNGCTDAQNHRDEPS